MFLRFYIGNYTTGDFIAGIGTLSTFIREVHSKWISRDLGYSSVTATMYLFLVTDGNGPLTSISFFQKVVLLLVDCGLVSLQNRVFFQYIFYMILSFYELH